MKSELILTSTAVNVEKQETAPRFFTIVFALTFTFCAVISPKTVTDTVSASAEFFVHTALPSMFPFMIASGMLIKSGFGTMCGKAVGKTFKKLFDLSGAFAAPLILGAIAGFPIGAKTVTELYKQDECSKEEAEKALALCSNPGFGFTVVGVGGVMWGSIGFGLSAWLSCIAASLFIGMITRGDNAVNPEIPLTQEHKNTEKKPLTSGKEYSISQTLTESVAEAAQTLLKICAFVVFFKTLTAVFLRFTASFPYLANINNNIVSAVITAIFEFSSGVSAISTAHSPIIKHELAQLIGEDMIPRLLTVSALAWSGISVHMQTAATAISCGISMKRYYRRKLATTLIAPIFFLILTLLCKRALARV